MLALLPLFFAIYMSLSHGDCSNRSLTQQPSQQLTRTIISNQPFPLAVQSQTKPTPHIPKPVRDKHHISVMSSFTPFLILFMCLFLQFSTHAKSSYFPYYKPVSALDTNVYGGEQEPQDASSAFKSESDPDYGDEIPKSVHTDNGMEDDYIPEFEEHDLVITKTTEVNVSYAATQFVSLFHNGMFVSRTMQYQQSRRDTLSVRQGDVLGFRAHSDLSWHGMIVDIQLGNRHYVTGRNAFRATSTYMANLTHNNLGWDARNSQKCTWAKPQVARRPSQDLFSKSFPFSGGAKYVWAPKANSGDDVHDVLLRYKFGGEHCRRTPSPSPTPPIVTVPVTSVSRCNCTLSDQGEGECFRFMSERAVQKGNGFCKQDACAPKYECVSNDGLSNNKPQTQCMTRYTSEEIRLVKQRPDGRLICEKAPVNPPKPYYVPYI